MQRGVAYTTEDIEFIEQCITSNKLHTFYTWSKWLRVRAEVLSDDKGECQSCKTQGLYTPANTVHHVNYVRRYPELALSKYYAYKGVEKRNLISLCHNCHEEVHGYRKKKQKICLTEERW